MGAHPRRHSPDPRRNSSAILPVFGLWMLPLGLILIAEDVPVVRRAVSRALAWMEKRWPGLFRSSE